MNKFNFYFCLGIQQNVYGEMFAFKSVLNFKHLLPKEYKIFKTKAHP